MYSWWITHPPQKLNFSTQQLLRSGRPALVRCTHSFVKSVIIRALINNIVLSLSLHNTAAAIIDSRTMRDLSSPTFAPIVWTHDCFGTHVATTPPYSLRALRSLYTNEALNTSHHHPQIYLLLVRDTCVYGVCCERALTTVKLCSESIHAAAVRTTYMHSTDGTKRVLSLYFKLLLDVSNMGIINWPCYLESEHLNGFSPLLKNSTLKLNAPLTPAGRRRLVKPPASYTRGRPIDPDT